jgi:hypothetical protein
MDDEPTPIPDSSVSHRCAMCGEGASYGFGPPGFPLQPAEAWYCGAHREVGRAGLGGALWTARTSVRERLSYLRYRLYAPGPVIVWFCLVFCALAFLGRPFSFIGFLVLVTVYLWVLSGAPP